MNPKIYTLLLGTLLMWIAPLFAQKAYYGTTQGVYNKMIRNKLQHSLKVTIGATRVLSEEEIKLQWARNNFWNAYPNGANLDTLREEYLNLLHEKDVYLVLRELFNYANHKHSGIGAVNPMAPVVAVLDLFDMLRDKEFDKGFDKIVAPEFKKWADAVNHYWSMHSGGSFNVDFIQENLIANIEHYELFVIARDKAEYLYRNPRSPLKSKDPIVYYKGVLLSSGVCTSLEEVEKYYNETLKKFSTTQISNGVQAYMKLHPEHLTTYFARLGFNSEPIREIERLMGM